MLPLRQAQCLLRWLSVIPAAMFVARSWVDEVAMFVAPFSVAAMFVGPGLQNDTAMFVALIIGAAMFVACREGQWGAGASIGAAPTEALH